MENMTVHSLQEDNDKQFFQFAKTLAGTDCWGKKGRYLRGNLERFHEFLDYIKPFEPKCFLVAKESDRFVGFVVAAYNPDWMAELRQRHEYDAEKRAYILGIAIVRRRVDVLKALTSEMMDYFSKRGIGAAEYPTLGNVCLTTGTDVLTSENVDSLILFREAGFKISECYYSMSLNLNFYKPKTRSSAREGTFHLIGRKIEILERNRILGRVTWNPVENGKTEIGIYVEPACRGKGFGAALMTKALEKLKTDGVKTVELGVDGNNLPALKLYRKFGFTVFKTHFYILIRSRTVTT
jgi:ribosomal protein S18 acetylase RimI-like enzyme